MHLQLCQGDRQHRITKLIACSSHLHYTQIKAGWALILYLLTLAVNLSFNVQDSFQTLAPYLPQELRVRGSYLHHKEIKAAQGVKIAAQNLESAVAGTQMLVAGPNDDVEVLKAEVMEDMKDIFGSVDRSGHHLLLYSGCST